MWAPRRAASRGEPSEQPRGASHASRSADRVLGQGDALGADGLDAGLGDDLDARLGGGQRDDPGRPDEPAADARAALEARAHLELVRLCEPALDRRSELVLELAPDVQERGRAGPAVEVLVRAADREVDAVRGEVDRDRAGRVREVPQDERARGAGGVGDGSDVDDRRRAVVDGREDQEGGVGVEGRGDVVGREALDRVAVEPADLEVSLPCQPLDDVPVRRELGALDDDRPTPGSGIERRHRARDTG